MTWLEQSVTSPAIKEHLLEFTRQKHEDFRFGDAGGKLMAKGIKFAHELIQQTPVLDDPAKYLDLLHELLLEEQSRIRGSSEDDPEGKVLAGMQTAMKEVEAEREML